MEVPLVNALIEWIHVREYPQICTKKICGSMLSTYSCQAVIGSCFKHMHHWKWGNRENCGNYRDILCKLLERVGHIAKITQHSKIMQNLHHIITDLNNCKHILKCILKKSSPNFPTNSISTSWLFSPNQRIGHDSKFPDLSPNQLWASAELGDAQRSRWVRQNSPRNSAAQSVEKAWRITSGWENHKSSWDLKPTRNAHISKKNEERLNFA